MSEFLETENYVNSIGYWDRISFVMYRFPHRLDQEHPGTKVLRLKRNGYAPKPAE